MSSSSLWTDSEIKKTIDLFDADTRYKYSKVYSKILDSIDGTMTGDEPSDSLEAATQIRLMLRDGLDVNDLTKDERKLLIEIFGAESMKTEFDIVDEDDDDKDESSISIAIG